MTGGKQAVKSPQNQAQTRKADRNGGNGSPSWTQTNHLAVNSHHTPYAGLPYPNSSKQVCLEALEYCLFAK
jgi:hypothetical protein